jgi:hypothetical protein
MRTVKRMLRRRRPVVVVNIHPQVDPAATGRAIARDIERYSRSGQVRA